MLDLSQLEVLYHRFMGDLPTYLPDGVQGITLETLHHMGLVNAEGDQEHAPSNLTKIFHVVESNDKITLFNTEFIVWVVPEHIGDETCTLVLIALNYEDKTPILETGFVCSGVYNTSKTVLRVLEVILQEIQENEQTLTELEES